MIEYSHNSIVVRDVDIKSRGFVTMHGKLSLWNPVFRKYINPVYYKKKVGKDKYNIYLPASLGVNFVSSYFPEKGLVFNPNMIVESSDIYFEMRNYPLDQTQYDAICFLENMKHDDNRERMIVMSTGVGKTFVAISAVKLLEKKTMIIVDSVDLAKQWKEKFLEHSEISEDDIFMISGSESVETALKDHENYKIFIAIHRTLYNLMEKKPSNIFNLFNTLKIGTRVFDECHVEYRNIIKINSFSSVDYTIYLTATPNRSSASDNRVYKAIFGNVPVFNSKETNNKTLQKSDIEKYHTVVTMQFNSNPTHENILKMSTLHGFSSAKWANYILKTNYDKVLNIIQDVVKKLKIVENKTKTVIMLPIIKMMDRVETDMREIFGENVGVFSGEVNKNKRTEELEKQIIITNDKIFERGLDVTDVEILINFSQFKSKVKTEQILGRIRNGNKKSIYIDVTDVGFEDLINFSKVRHKLLKQKAKAFKETDFTY